MEVMRWHFTFFVFVVYVLADGRDEDEYNVYSDLEVGFDEDSVESLRQEESISK
jgi:hypothetical protein